MAHLPSLADAPGTLREYETIYILKPDTINDQVADVNQRVRTIIEERGGKILKVDNWGKRRLAYEVRKQLKGIYLYWKYLGSSDIVAEFERNMRMLDAVIRYMTVKIDTDVVPDGRASEVDDETFDRAANTAADEEDLMFRGSGDGDGEGDGEGEGYGDGDGEGEGAGEPDSDQETKGAKEEERAIASEAAGEAAGEGDREADRGEESRNKAGASSEEEE
jgi:small subunit ribosomal protein S6